MSIIDPVLAANPSDPISAGRSAGAPTRSFARLIEDGLGSVEAKLARADGLAARFAVDDSIPLHQVTLALEEARLSVELMMQVRGRLLEAYQDVMRMQI